jgi:hypothetical protein
MGSSKVPGLMPDGSIRVESIQKIRDLYPLLEYLQSFFSQYHDYSLIFKINGNSGEVTFICPYYSKKAKIDNFDGSRPADFLNTLGILREYDNLRENNERKNNDEEYPEIGTKIDVGGLKGYGFPPESVGEILSYRVFPDYPGKLYAIVKTPYGEMPISADLLKGREIQRRNL